MDPLDALDFGKAGGLVTAIAQDDRTDEILMVAFMNEEAFRRTLETGEAVYWSRSRAKLWHKGEQSGNTQKVKAVFTDCDGRNHDAILRPGAGKAKGHFCRHAGTDTCFRT